MSPQHWLASYGAIPAHIDPDSHPSIVHLLCAAMQRYAHRPAFTCLGQTLTYAHVDQQSRAFAAYLQNVLRVRKGDRIAVMRDGRIVQIGTPEEILTDPANDYVEQFVQDVDRARVLTADSVMEPARPVVPATGGPRAALKTMRDLQTSAAFVVGRDKKIRGVVTDRAAMKLVRAGESDLSSILTDDYSAVNAQTPLFELFIPAVETPLPLAVTDDAGKLLGVVPRVTLLAALGGGSTATGEISLPEQPLPLPADVIDDLLADENVKETR